MKVCSTKAKKPFDENETNIEMVSWITRKTMRPVVKETKLRCDLSLQIPSYRDQATMRPVVTETKLQRPTYDATCCYRDRAAKK